MSIDASNSTLERLPNRKITQDEKSRRTINKLRHIAGEAAAAAGILFLMPLLIDSWDRSKPDVDIDAAMQASPVYIPTGSSVEQHQQLIEHGLDANKGVVARIALGYCVATEPAVADQQPPMAPNPLVLNVDNTIYGYVVFSDRGQPTVLLAPDEAELEPCEPQPHLPAVSRIEPATLNTMYAADSSKFAYVVGVSSEPRCVTEADALSLRVAAINPALVIHTYIDNS